MEEQAEEQAEGQAGLYSGAWRAHLQAWPRLGSLKPEPTVKGSVDLSKECVFTLRSGCCSQAVTGRGLCEKEHSSSWAADGPVRESDRSRRPEQRKARKRWSRKWSKPSRGERRLRDGAWSQLGLLLLEKEPGQVLTQFPSL